MPITKHVSILPMGIKAVKEKGERRWREQKQREGRRKEEEGGRKRRKDERR